MTKPERRIPLALRLAAWLLPAEVRDEVLGDLHEAWLARSRSQPRMSVLLWTLRQPLAALRARWAPAPGERRTPIVQRAPGFAFSWIDVKLGVRMLLKRPVLSIVAGLTLAVGIPSALSLTHLMYAYGADLPVDEGGRIVGLRYWDAESGRAHLNVIHDLVVWQESLTSVTDLGAASPASYNLHSPDGRAVEVPGAEVTASVFDLLRVRLNRPFQTALASSYPAWSGPST